MDKEKQVDEIAKLICSYPQCVNYNVIGGCKVSECRGADNAENVYNADYRKQSEGEWISNRQTGEYICNLCGGIAPVDCEKEDFYKSNYCPNCGAKMKGGAG